MPVPNNTQQSQETHINAPGGIRTHNPSNRAAADPRLRPSGQWEPNKFSNEVFIQIYAWFQVFAAMSMKYAFFRDFAQRGVVIP
jgi:hypothetical protein